MGDLNFERISNDTIVALTKDIGRPKLAPKSRASIKFLAPHERRGLEMNWENIPVR